MNEEACRRRRSRVLRFPPIHPASLVRYRPPGIAVRYRPIRSRPGARGSRKIRARDRALISDARVFSLSLSLSFPRDPPAQFVHPSVREITSIRILTRLIPPRPAVSRWYRGLRGSPPSCLLSSQLPRGWSLGVGISLFLRSFDQSAIIGGHHVHAVTTLVCLSNVSRQIRKGESSQPLGRNKSCRFSFRR